MVGRTSGFQGYWATHELDKGSVFEDINEWCSWEEMEEKVGQLNKNRDKRILQALFETGGRVSSVIQLKDTHFEVNDGLVKVKGMPLVKSSQLSRRWPFYIKKDEPLMKPLLSLIESDEDKYLFPSPLGKNPYISRQYVWKFINETLELYPHWFRAMRAFCLSWEYGLTRSELKDWFTWLDEGTAQHYARSDPRAVAEKFL